jgi:hypothetical protein
MIPGTRPTCRTVATLSLSRSLYAELQSKDNYWQSNRNEESRFLAGEILRCAVFRLEWQEF